MSALTAARRITAWRLTVVLATLTFAGAAPAADGKHDDLLKLFADYQAWQVAALQDPVPDYSRQALAARGKELAGYERRLAAMDARRWPIPAQVDYLTVRAEIDQQIFIRQVTRPWSRDPVFYVAPLLEVGFTALPATGTELQTLETRLDGIPGLLRQARQNLTEVAADYADLAMRSLTLSDGVENGFPYRADPPDGIIGWFQDLRGRASTAQPALLPKIDTALAALEEFHLWLVDNRLVRAIRPVAALYLGRNGRVVAT